MPRFDYTAAIEELQTLRTTNERRSEHVAAVGARLIREKHMAKLNDQVWPVYEQITIAALDVNDFELADHCLGQLEARFGDNSMRLQRLKGMRLEAQGKLSEAQAVYDKILERDPTHMLTSKRQIVLLKERNLNEEAIEALVKYLDTYYDDQEAWSELCNMYLDQHLYEQAAFCCEELIVQQPANHIWYLKYAEILYTMGQLALALKHYCKVLELCTDHVRALYGLHLCATKLSNVEHATDLHALATERLLAVYKNGSESTRKLVQDYLSM
ncbi:er membrane protein complex subunit 2 [Lichtheimia corymbifera JMRC:FSU:9682]|uniref:ER membrane protein complex subunit 2 n=1 Tax=Lichtheimia corymbifera JMRC:FSU:9682 TaxID=1263082 RepID=A0A068SCS2_9FUNG|nr:er membrane protein complex subunit 2 [Lichtheimia corymbifera JMRC:FSU:9682]